MIDEAYLREDKILVNCSLLRGRYGIEISVILNIECSPDSTLYEVVLQQGCLSVS